MSKQLLNNYYNKLEETIRFGGSRNEGSVSIPFFNLVNAYAEKRNLRLVHQRDINGLHGKKVRPDGVVTNALNLEFGIWESKDEKDDIHKEIQAKIAKGYPLTNTLFEDTNTAILFQGGTQADRADMKKPDELDRVLNAFIDFEPPQVREFNKALVKFTEDVPTIVQSLRELIQTEADTNKDFIAKRDEFLMNCRTEINPEITLEDVREMIIQHILTEDIFNNIFGDSGFLQNNNIARELEVVISMFMTRAVRQNYLGNIRSYYDTIRDAASGIADHHEKQKFLKNIYENFYKVYNPKGADRLGVVYTPNEIVRFMIESTDYLLEKHFNTSLAEKNVEILDPATGTGTFVAELIEHIPAQYLPHKFEHEIHANEVAILPYYIANLNIEYTYQQKIGKYKEFTNICFVDTLDNLAFKTIKNDPAYFDKYAQTPNMLGGLSKENAARIKRQNERKISVIIGNPPYNANQANFNDFNRNRDYDVIDRRIKDTFVKNSTAQKTKVYDMYARFYRWSMDRIDENGVLAFVTNRSFIDSRTFDGFRKSVEDDFDYAYIIDTRSDVRANPKIAGTSHNVFGIQTGVAVMFLVKKAHKEKHPCRIQYVTMDDFWRKETKLEWFGENPLSSISFERITPNKKHNWINLADTDFESLLPLIDKSVKSGKKDEAVFKLFSLGVVTARDEWVYDFDLNNLQEKVGFFCEQYQRDFAAYRKQPEKEVKNLSVKYTSEIEGNIKRGNKLTFSKNNFRLSAFRPFVKKNTYYDKIITHRLYQQEFIFPLRSKSENKLICVNIGNKNFNVLAVDTLPDYHLNGDCNCIPLYRYNGYSYQENITDWGLRQFQTHYKDKTITREDIFHYTYAALHHPAYRRKYELNLKREFPRLPFYADFRQWAAWGKELMILHIDYETAKPFKLKIVHAKTNSTPRPKLKADKTSGTIELDSETTLQGVPSSAWEYKLGNRSALEWILDQYKEKKPQDATIREKFNSYRFADYKETVIDLLRRVCTVSVKTVELVNQMPKEDWPVENLD